MIERSPSRPFPHYLTSRIFLASLTPPAVSRQVYTPLDNRFPLNVTDLTPILITSIILPEEQ